MLKKILVGLFLVGIFNGCGPTLTKYVEGTHECAKAKKEIVEAGGKIVKVEKRNAGMNGRPIFEIRYKE